MLFTNWECSLINGSTDDVMNVVTWVLLEIFSGFQLLTWNCQPQHTLWSWSLYALNLVKFADQTTFYGKTFTAQKVKFSIKDFFSKCDQFHRFRRNCLCSVFENFTVCAMFLIKLMISFTNYIYQSVWQI